MRHHRSKQYINWLTIFGGHRGVPQIQEALLQREFPPIELPVVVDGDRWGAGDERRDVWEEGFAGEGDVVADVGAAVGGVVLVLSAVVSIKLGVGKELGKCTMTSMHS